jgi:predicted glycogen debranching enzyme
MHDDLTRTIRWWREDAADPTPLIDREWLVTNGLGGYASGTLAGAATRRYHGLLIAAHPAPLGRVMMFNHLTESFRFADWTETGVGGVEHSDGTLELRGADILTEFRLDLGLPVWRYTAHDHVIEKRVYLPHQQNTVHVRYTLVDGPGPVRLKLRPSFHFRGHDDPVSTRDPGPYTLTAAGGRYELTARHGDFPTLRMVMDGESPALTLDGLESPEILYRVEESRGYEGVGSQWSPGFFRDWLKPGRDVTLTASTEQWPHVLALPPADAWEAERERRQRLITIAGPSAKTRFGAELVLAADQFIIDPVGRPTATARAHAAGDEPRTVIAGYHWFTDWGRDTMISLDGLALATGRHAEAGFILRTFAANVRDGLIPNYFPDREQSGVYHTADATLWFFHAVHRYVEVTNDRQTLRKLLPTFRDIFRHHVNGTRFGIGVDPADGLLRQGAEGYQLTWMDAKVGDWVVTPRRGKAVEINALWYNAARLLEGWEKVFGGDPTPAGAAAERCRQAFNRRFWNDQERMLFDVIDGEGGDDPACRPNQLFAISLPNPVLDEGRWKAVVDVCRERLLTPFGMRSLAPGHPDYKSRYFGDLRSRDAAYHQGTVWPWLIGPFLDAWAKAYPDRTGEGRQFLAGFVDHLNEACVGSISEVMDAEAPYTPRACVAQAWSVAEVLRQWVRFGN